VIFPLARLCSRPLTTPGPLLLAIADGIPISGPIIASDGSVRIDAAALSTRGTGPGSRRTTMRQTSFGTNGVARHFPPVRAGRPEEGDAPEDFMSHPDYPARLRDFVRLCRTAADHSHELEAKTSFRTIAEGLSTMADEIERSGAPKGSQDLGAAKALDPNPDCEPTESRQRIAEPRP
jgi:hypothetical protein